MNTCKQYKKSINNENLKISDIKLNDDEVRLTIMDLPNEIVLKIFSYLKPTCLLRRVSLVCKTWKALAEDSSLWKTLYLNSRKRRINFTRVLFKYKFVQDLSISGWRIEDRFVKALSQLSALRSLDLYSCTIPHLKMKDSFRKLSLTSLKLGRIRNPNGIFDITDLKMLKSLELSYCTLYEKESLIASFKRCSHLENVLFLCLKHPPHYIMDEIVDSIIISSDTLVNFTLLGYTTDRAFLNLNKCSKLSKLCIYNLCYLSDSILHNLSDSILLQIMNLNRLKELHLNPCNGMTSQGINQLFSEGQISNLICLELEYCKTLNDSNLITIANCCKKLSVLKITNNAKVTDVGMSAIVNKCSEIVDLILINLDELKGSFLLEIKENLLKYLKKVDLTRTSVERTYVAVLRAARPEVQIVDEI